jgi:hypothetical protein
MDNMNELSSENGSKDPTDYRRNGDGRAIYAYNVDEGKRIGGMKVRVKLRVLTGEPAARADGRQAEAIRELLQWARHHRHSAR